MATPFNSGSESPRELWYTRHLLHRYDKLVTRTEPSSHHTPSSTWACTCGAYMTTVDSESYAKALEIIPATQRVEGEIRWI